MDERRDARAIPVARMSREASELLAAKALGFVAADPDRLGRFLAISGLDPATIRSAAESPAFLIGVLDYLNSDQELLAAFSIENQTHPTAATAASDALAPNDRENRPTTRSRASPLRTRCQHCRKEAPVDRRQRPNVPGVVAVIAIARCGPCGSSLDLSEEWLDAEGNSLLPY
jgi:hypothetical protein